MSMHGNEKGQETNYTYDHKKILKLFFRWFKLGSRDFKDVGDPAEEEKHQVTTSKRLFGKRRVVDRFRIQNDDAGC